MSEQEIRQIAQLIYRQVLGTLPPEEAEELKAWREQSGRNEALYRKLTDVRYLEQEYRKLHQVDVERPLADMKSRVARRSVRRVMLQVAGVAAMLALLLWGGFTLYVQQQENRQLQAALQSLQIRPGQTQATLFMADSIPIELDTNDSANRQKIARQKELMAHQPAAKGAPATNLLVTPRGGEFKIVLADSTEVWLNAESKLIYPEVFDMDERRVSVQGEAYFKVKKDVEKPFYVETDGQVVRVYGTEFNVRSYAEDDVVYTTLVSGQVSVSPLHAHQGELVLTPNNQSLFHKTEKTTSVHRVNTDIVTGWKKGMFVFEEQNLEQIMQTLGRWYDFETRFEDEELKQTVFMGSILRYAEFNDVIQILEKSGGLRISVKDRTVTVSSKRRE